MIAIYASLDDDRRAELDRESLEFDGRCGTPVRPGGPAALPVEYLLIVGRRRD